SPDAASSSAMNCRSVASSALSGMLLTSPISTQPTTALAMRGSEPLSTRRGMRWLRSRSCGSLGRDHAALIGLGGVERLVEVRQNVFDVLDADAQPDHLGPHAGLALLLRRHLPMGGRGRMAGERFRVAHVDQALE